MTAPAGTRSTALDLVRALAAVVVMCGHLRNALLPDFDQLASPGIALKAFYLVSGMGHQAVIVFFVLSGYLVGGSVIRAGHRFDWRDYAITRLSRLWIVLVPAIAATALLDHALGRFHPAAFDAAHVASWHSMPAAGDYSASLATAFGNLLFLQTVVVSPFGSNGPLWSLANEAWYYLLFPCLWNMGRTGVGRWQRVISLLVAAGAVALMPGPMLALFLVWLMGAVIHLVPRHPLWTSRGYAGASIAVLLAVLVAARWGAIPGAAWLLPDHAAGLALAAWLLHVHNYAPAQPSRMPLEGLVREASEMSYSLYLLHMPLVFVLASLVAPGHKLEADAAGFGVYIALAFVIVALSRGFWWLFERNTTALKRQLLSRWGRAPAPLAPASTRA